MAKSFNEIMDKVQGAFYAQFGHGGGDIERWILEVYDSYVVVRWEDGKLFQVGYTMAEDGAVAFAGPDEWQAVKRAYVPIAEGLRILRIVAARKAEPEGREWDVVVIGPEKPEDLVEADGEIYVRSKNGRLYKVTALEASTGLWDGVKVYDNHLTDEEFERRQGMRSVAAEWLGVIVQPWWDAAAKAVKGVLKVVDDNLRQKLVNAEAAQVLDKIGLSIDALGEGGEATINGEKVIVVEKIARALSVDVVADPAAGGRLARMIAGRSPLTDSDSILEAEMDEEKLLKLVNDSVSAALGGFREEVRQMVEAQSGAGEDPGEEAPDVEEPEAETPEAEAEELPEAVQEALRTANERLAQIEQRTRLAECTHTLGLKLQESGLPESFRELVAQQFRGKVFKEAELDQAIKAQREALTRLSESGKIVLPEGARMDVSPLTEWDRYELSFLRLVAGATRFGELVTKENAQYHGAPALQRYIEAGRPALPIARKLSEWYYSFTEDYDGLGRMRNPRYLEANLTTTTLTSIVKNTVNLLLAADYSVREQWWAPIVRQEDVDSLDQATLVRVFGISNLSTLSEGAAYTESTWADEEETASYQKRGNYIGVTLETFLLDKLSRLRTLPTRLSNAAYNTISALVSGVFTLNTGTGPTLADTGVLFNATAVTTGGGHANLRTTALSYTEFAAIRTAMMKQTDQPLGVGRRLMIQPRYLLVPVDLETAALQIRNSEMLPGSANNDVNPYYQKFDVVPVPDWTDVNNFATVGDPAVFPAIWLIWLRGRRVPEIFAAEDERSGAMFTNDELRFKIRQWTFQKSSSEECAPVSDWRPLHKSNVAG